MSFSKIIILYIMFLCVEECRKNGAYIQYIIYFRSLSFMVTMVLYECVLLVLMVAYMLFWVKIEYFKYFILWYNVEY
jgi:hypothetical protein